MFAENLRGALLGCLIGLVAGVGWIDVPAARASEIFGVSEFTHAVVDSSSPVLAGGGDNNNTFSSGYIYNIFGAANPGVEGTGDMLFNDGLTTNVVDFHTAYQVSLTDVVVNGAAPEGGTGDRAYSSFTLQQFSDNTYTTPVGSAFTYTGLAPGGPVDLPVSVSDGQYFQLAFQINPAAAFNTQGVRLYSVQGFGAVVPEPSSVVLMGFAGLGLLFAARRRQRAV